jgi:hypothetical protein
VIPVTRHPYALRTLRTLRGPFGDPSGHTFNPSNPSGHTFNPSGHTFFASYGDEEGTPRDTRLILRTNPSGHTFNPLGHTFFASYGDEEITHSTQSEFAQTLCRIGPWRRYAYAGRHDRGQTTQRKHARPVNTGRRHQDTRFSTLT